MASDAPTRQDDCGCVYGPGTRFVPCGTRHTVVSFAHITVSEPRPDRPVSAELPDVIFRGLRDPEGIDPVTITIHNTYGVITGDVKHVIKHSPTGMEWGYHGSGAADCARSLLLAAVAGQLKCPVCQGARNICYDGETERPAQENDNDEDLFACRACEDGTAIGPAVYQEFKRAFVAGWQTGEWSLSRKTILAWGRLNFPELLWPHVV